MDAETKARLMAKAKGIDAETKARLMAKVGAAQAVPDTVASSEPEVMVSMDGIMPFSNEPVSGASAGYDTKGLNDALRQVSKGATFNIAPRAIAAARSAVGKKTYSEELAYEQAQNEAYEKENPITSMVLQGAGGVAVPGPAMLNAGRHAYVVARNLGAGRRAGQAAGVAAVSAPAGAASSYFESKDLSDIPKSIENAATGFAVGGVAGPVIGGALHKGAALAGKAVDVADSVQSFVTGIGAQRRATNKIADTIERRNVAAGQGENWEMNTRNSAGDFQRQVAGARVPGVNDTIALSSDDLADLTRGNITQKGVDRNDIAAMGDRVIGDASTPGSQSERLSGVVENLRPGYGHDGYDRRVTTLRQNANDAFDPFYNDIRDGQVGPYRQWVPMAGLTDALRRFPALRAHYDNALQGAHMSPATPGVTDATAGVMAGNQGRIHADVLRRMRTSLSQAKNTSPGGVEADGLALVDNILAQGSIGQVFQGRVRDHANAKALQESFESGSNLWSTTGPRRANALDEFEDMGRNPTRHGGPTQSPVREAEYLNGAAGALQKRIDADTGNLSVPRRSIGSRENVDTMRTLFPRGNVDDFVDAVEREGTLNERAISIIESATGALVNKAELLNMGLRSYIKAKFNPGAGVADIVDKVSPGSRKQRRELVRQLTSGAQADMDRVTENLSRRDAKIARKFLVRQHLAQGLIASDLDNDEE